MVLTSHPFSLSVSPSNFFAASGTFMTWSCAASHFFGGTFRSRPHFYGRSFHSLTYFYGRSFRVRLHFYGRTYSNSKMHKHEKKTKKTRKKHEVLRIFRLTKEKISGLNWTTESKGSKWRFEIKGSKRAFDQLVKVAKWSKVGLVENQPHHFVPRWREVTNFIAGCDEVALKNATS